MTTKTGISRVIAMAVVMLGVAALIAGGCGSHRADSANALVQLPDVALRERLIEHFPIGLTREAVRERAAQLGLAAWDVPNTMESGMPVRRGDDPAADIYAVGGSDPDEASVRCVRFRFSADDRLESLSLGSMSSPLPPVPVWGRAAAPGVGGHG